MRDLSISVFFPCYNEDANLERSARAALDACRAMCSNFEVIIVNDGSRDRRGEIADHRDIASAYRLDRRESVARRFNAWAWTTLVAAAILAGCAAPEPQPAELRQPQGEDALLLMLPQNPEHPRQLEWLPDSGRLSAYARNRHLPPAQTPPILLVDEFTGAVHNTLPGWRAVGAPTVERTHLEGREGVELSAPESLSSPCGFERDLIPSLVQGRDLRMDLRLACRSPRDASALSGVRLSVAATDAAGQRTDVALPVAADVAPGWETQRWWLRVDPQLRGLTLRIRLERPGARLTVDRLSVTGFDVPAPREGTPSAATRPSVGPVNLIVGGDFESGGSCFYASDSQRWPNGDETPLPLAWDYDTQVAGERPGPAGRRSLHLLVAGETGRVGFGPLNLSHAAGRGETDSLQWHLSFQARAGRLSKATVSLRTRGRLLERATFRLSEHWQAFSHVFTIRAGRFRDRVELAAAELVFDLANAEPAAPLDCWLDAVALTDAPAPEAYIQAAPVEVGIVGPRQGSGDLAGLIGEGDPAVFEVRLAAQVGTATQGLATTAPAAGRPAGKLAMDLLDAWDRVLWTRTTEPVIPQSGLYSEPVSFALARGYYRLLASLWSGEPGASSLVSQAESRCAVISFEDPVPLANAFGLTAHGGYPSIYTTALGAGWVRMDLPADRVETEIGSWDFSLWQSLTGRCRQADAELVAGLTLPIIERFRKSFVDGWLASNPIEPLGVVISPPAIASRPVQEYREQLSWLSERLAAASPSTTLVCDLSALNDRAGEFFERRESKVPAVLGIAATEPLLPEASEPLLEEIGRLHGRQARIWDLGIPVRIGGAPDLSGQWRMLAPVGTIGGPVQRIDAPPDPVLSASRMVRAVLIRGLAGVRLACCDAVALSPVRSIHEDDRHRLHENDMSPRAALVAFEWMTSLLNDAVLIRWIDLPGRGRVLYFEKDDGGAVAALWRPFGLSPTRVGLSGLPERVQVYDCVGVAEPARVEEDRRVVEINEFVRYIVAPPGQAESLRASLDSIELLFGSADEAAASAAAGPATTRPLGTAAGP